VAVASVTFLLVPLFRFLYLLILQELVWRWWLGYGERPSRVLVIVALILGSTWILYWQVGTFVLDPGAKPPITGQATWQDALYYSVVSLAALGYGGWVAEPVGWARWVGALEAFVGIISAVALSITLTQRITL
jgi:hypothetical protein